MKGKGSGNSKIRIDDAEVKAAFLHTKKNMEPELEKSIKAAAAKAQMKAKIMVPRRSGTLGSSIEVLNLKGGAYLSAGKGTPYGAPIHWGWKARNIEPSLFLTNAIDAKLLSKEILGSLKTGSVFSRLNLQ